MAELYELVQYAGNILPRLYLLITVGSVYIRSKEAPAKDVLRDLVEMCRGVQHPTRGLFLRNYLSEMTKDKLPDTGSEYEGRGGNVNDSIEFILQNFTEMNKLWVRMQHQGPAKDRDKREGEREELRLLVGKNLARLSQLDGVDIEKYSKLVLPSIVEQIVNCKDQIAQQYLMECLIQVFPDDYHLRTLEVILSTCGQLQPAVDIKTIIVSLIDRLANYATKNREQIPEDIRIFEIFSDNIAKVIEQRTKMPPEDILALQVALLNLSLKCYPANLTYVNTVLGYSASVLNKMKENSSNVDLHAQITVKQILKLLSIPLENYKNVLTVLQLENYPNLISFLSFPNRKKVAVDIVKNAKENATFITDVEKVNKLLEWIQPLIKDETDQSDVPVDKEDFDEEQNLVASLIHLFDSENPEELFLMYNTARKHFGQGGAKRLQHTLPPLIFRSLILAAKLKSKYSKLSEEEWSVVGKKIFRFAHENTTMLARTELPEVSFRIFLQCAHSANNCGFEVIAYEFLTQAFVIFENEIPDSKAQVNAVDLLIGTIQNLRCFGEENYDTLVTKCAQHSSKLLKKPDQARAIYLCSHLFWSGRAGEKPYHDGKRVLECLQKSLKIADACMNQSQNVHLFVEILNKYLYYFDQHTETVTMKYLGGLIALINTNLANIDSSSSESVIVKLHFQNTLKHIKKKKESDPTYAELEV